MPEPIYHKHQDGRYIRMRHPSGHGVDVYIPPVYNELRDVVKRLFRKALAQGEISGEEYQGLMGAVDIYLKRNA